MSDEILTGQMQASGSLGREAAARRRLADSVHGAGKIPGARNY